MTRYLLAEENADEDETHGHLAVRFVEQRPGACG